MAAPTNAALLDYETNYESAVATYLASVLTGTQIVTPQTIITAEGELETPRVAVVASISGTNPNQQGNRSTDGAEYDSHKLGTLSLACATRRDASGQSFGTLRGKVRVAMLRATAALNASNLPYYQTITLREASASMTVDTTNDEIVSTLNYSLEFYIKPDQWAAS